MATPRETPCDCGFCLCCGASLHGKKPVPQDHHAARDRQWASALRAFLEHVGAASPFPACTDACAPLRALLAESAPREGGEP